jgi:hypothetical protein
VNESADLRAQLGTLEAQRAAAETVAATAGGSKAGQAGGLLLDDTALAGKEGRGVLPWQSRADPRRAPECCSVVVLLEGIAAQ